MQILNHGRTSVRNFFDAVWSETLKHLFNVCIITMYLKPLFQIVNIFNLFITYGDTFLPNPNSYDELYYEVIRMHQVFDNLYSMGEQFSMNMYKAYSVFHTLFFLSYIPVHCHFLIQKHHFFLNSVIIILQTVFENLKKKHW